MPAAPSTSRAEPTLKPSLFPRPSPSTAKACAAVPLVTLNPPSSGVALVNVTSTTATDDVTLQDIAFAGVNGGNIANWGVLVNAPADFDALTIDRSTFTGFQLIGVSVNGDATTGIAARNVAISNSTFTNNGSDTSGAGDIDLFTYNGDASFTNLTLSNNGAANSRLGIQLRGVGPAPAWVCCRWARSPSTASPSPASTRPSSSASSAYSNVTTLSFNNVALGGATSEITGTFVHFCASTPSAPARWRPRRLSTSATRTSAACRQQRYRRPTSSSHRTTRSPSCAPMQPARVGMWRQGRASTCLHLR